VSGWFSEFCEAYGLPESYFKPLKDKTYEEVVKEGASAHDKNPPDDIDVGVVMPISVRLKSNMVSILNSLVHKHKNLSSRNKVIAFAMKLGVTFGSKYDIKPYGKLRNLLVETVGNVGDRDLFEMMDKEIESLDTLADYKEKGAVEFVNLRPFWWVNAYVSDFGVEYHVCNKSVAAKLLLYYGLSRSERWLPKMYRVMIIDSVNDVVNAVNNAYRSSIKACKRVCWYLSRYDEEELKKFVAGVEKIDGELHDEIVRYVATLS